MDGEARHRCHSYIIGPMRESTSNYVVLLRDMNNTQLNGVFNEDVNSRFQYVIIGQQPTQQVEDVDSVGVVSVNCEGRHMDAQLHNIMDGSADTQGFKEEEESGESLVEQG